MEADFKAWVSVPVRWGDMDAFQHVNNALYFTYCESARIRYFERIRLDEFREHERQGPAVVSATCNFRRQVRYPATLVVGARTGSLGRTSFVLEYGIFRLDSAAPAPAVADLESGGGGAAPPGEPVADGSSVVVWVDYGRETAVALPAALRQRITEFDRL